jgi:hypothetical protein
MHGDAPITTSRNSTERITDQIESATEQTARFMKVKDASVALCLSGTSSLTQKIRQTRLSVCLSVCLEWQKIWGTK